MKSKIVLISCLMGLGLIVQEVKGNNASMNTLSSRSAKSETLSEVIQTLIKKENSNTKMSAAILTITALEDYRNSNTAYIKLNEAEKVTFNQTIQAIINQANNIPNGKSLSWLRDIKKSTKAINTIWAILNDQYLIDAPENKLSDADQNIIVVFHN